MVVATAEQEAAAAEEEGRIVFACFLRRPEVLGRGLQLQEPRAWAAGRGGRQPD